jgi:RNA polymerase sigma-70 factor, ECF subfamily
MSADQSDGSWPLDPQTLDRLYREAKADQWSVTREAFGAAVERSVRRALTGTPPEARQLDRHLSSLHLADLALACACAEGNDAAWEHFIREYRPVLYRAADAIDPTGGARDLADALYGELFGLTERDGERRSHFRYFHARSSLSTWLRAVLSQRHVDRFRADRRLEPLPTDDAPHAIATTADRTEPKWRRYVELIREAVIAATAALAPRDRLRLSCYYAQDLTLAQIGRALNEHEATVSRHLSRCRRTIREGVEAHLREREGMSDAEISECFRLVADNVGSLDVAELVGAESDEERKKMPSDRSR